MAANGRLGVWLSVDRSVAQRFGEYCLEVSAAFSKIFYMDIGLLSKLHVECCRVSYNLEGRELEEREASFYLDCRERLACNGYDAIAIRELDGRVEMYVALDPSRLEILNEFDRSPISPEP